jgi:hypothetical protein
MRKRVKISFALAAEIDAVRGELSRAKYLDALLKKYQGVTRSHTPADRDCPKSRKNKNP